MSFKRNQQKRFDKVATEIIAEQTDKEFADFLSKDIGETEIQIYKGATKLATCIEFLEQEKNVPEFTKFLEIGKSLDEFKKLPETEEFFNTDSALFRLLQKLSKLRNQNRWAPSSYNVNCSVLGHLFDTAIFAYLMALNESEFDETYATKMFFMGIYHDIAETWTKDIPSPIKDRMEGLRKATEKYENAMLQKHIYSIVPDYLAQAIKDVMIEEAGNAEYKVKLKEADYLSADSECYRNLLSGSRDGYFIEAIVCRHINSKASKAYQYAHQYFVDYAKKINL